MAHGHQTTRDQFIANFVHHLSNATGGIVGATGLVYPPSGGEYLLGIMRQRCAMANGLAATVDFQKAKKA